MDASEATDARDRSDELYALCERLYPICRSITGDGVRKTLTMLQDLIPLQIHEIASGTPVFDWEVPQEWNLRGAYIENSRGERVVDAARHNLHVVGYSTPIDTNMSREALEAHLFSLPEQPDLIPYRTSYFTPDWGFCLSHNDRAALPDGTYHVVIDSALSQGALSYGEFFIPGQLDQEILISTHICHPSLANDNVSGISVSAHLADSLRTAGSLLYGLRFIFVPSTIGAIAWLACNEAKIPKIVTGLVISGVGDTGPLTYKKSRDGEGLADKILERLISVHGQSNLIRPFLPYGYDERQYCSPGIGIAAGCLMRTPYGEYPEYHTSADNLDFINSRSLGEALDLCLRAINEMQHVAYYLNRSPKGEPQLGRRGLYDAIGGDNEKKKSQLALLWMLCYSDGLHSTLDISNLSGIDLATLDLAARRLTAADLLEVTSFPTLR